MSKKRFHDFAALIISFLCGAHLQRELKGVMENNPDQRWAPQFFDPLSAMKHAKDSAIASGQNALNEKLIEEYEAQYDELLRLGHEENPFVPSPKKRGRKKKGKTLSLIERLEKYKGSVCLFIHNFAVPFTNNAAERSVRPCKVKIRVAGCFRTKRGANNYLDVMSYLDTARKRGHNPFRALNDAILGRPCLIFT